MNFGKGTAPKRARFADTPVIVGGGNAPAVPGAAEPRPPPPVPEDTSSDDGTGAAIPDGEQKTLPNTPAQTKSLEHLLTRLPKNDHLEVQRILLYGPQRWYLKCKERTLPVG